MATVLSCNVRGMGTPPSNTRARLYVTDLVADVVCFQETNVHSSFVDSHLWKLWPYRFWHAVALAPSGSGVSLGLSPRLCPLVRHFEAYLSNCIYMRVELSPGVITHFFGVYVPSRDDPVALSVLDRVDRLLALVPAGDPVLLMGDFNCTLDPALDRRGCLERRPALASSLSSIVTRFDLRDAFRILQPDTRAYTWSAMNHGRLLRARLDRFYVDSLSPPLACYHTSCPWSDHSAVVLRLAPSSGGARLRPAYWRMNVQALEDTVFVAELRSFIVDSIAVQSRLSHVRSWCQWWFGVFKPQVRSLVRDFWSACVSRTRRRLRAYEAELRSLGGGRSDRAAALRLLIASVYESRARDALLQARVAFVGQVDAPSADFFRWTSRSLAASEIRSVYDQFGQPVFSQKAVRSRIAAFYTELYAPPAPTVPPVGPTRDLFRVMPTLPLETVADLDEPFLLRDFTASLRSLARGRSPGLDGLPVEFYGLFWPEVGQALLQVYRELLTSPASAPFASLFSRSVLCLLPKTGDLRDLRHWRPLSLTNVDYKIFAKFLATRLAGALDSVVSPSQSYSLPRRSIFDKLHTLRDLIDLSHTRGEPLALVNIDQEKAFDAIRHDYLFALLRHVGVPLSFRRAIALLYTDAHFHVKVNDSLTNAVPFSRGVRQGCPLSGLLYSLAIDPLLRLLSARLARSREAPPHTLLTSSAYADDVTALVRSDSEFHILRECLDAFSSVTGARINNAKTVGLWCGSWLGRQDAPLGFRWTSEGHKVLGVFLGNTSAYLSRNWVDLETCLLRVLGRWRPIKFNVSLFGRVHIANQLAASVLWHRFKVLPPPPDFLLRCQTALLAFIWDRVHWVSKEVCVLPRPLGGLGLVSLASKVSAFRIAFAVSLVQAHVPLQCHVTARTFLIPGQPCLSAVLCTAAPPPTGLFGYYASLWKDWSPLPFRLSLDFCAWPALARVPVFDCRGVLDPEGFPLSGFLHRRFIANNCMFIADFLDPVTRSWRSLPDLLALAASPSRLTVQACSVVRSCIISSFPEVFDGHGVRSDFVFGSRLAPTILLPASKGGPVLLFSKGLARMTYSYLIDRCPLRPRALCPPPLNFPSRSPWCLKRLSPLSSRLEHVTHWRSLHSALPVPRRLVHMAPAAYPSAGCPGCPALGDVVHMYLDCPLVVALLGRVNGFLTGLYGHGHDSSSYWFLVPAPGHFPCNFAYVLLKDVLYHDGLGLAGICRDLFSDFTLAVDRLFLRFRGRFVARVALAYRWAARTDAFEHFRALWGLDGPLP